MGLKSNKVTVLCCALLAMLAANNSYAGNKKGWIHVYDSAQLQAAMQPANAGRNILVHSGNYSVSTTLIVPDRATLRGEGKMLYDNQGYPDGFAEASGTNLEATLDLVGDIVALGNGSTIENIRIGDIDGGVGVICSAAEVNGCQVAPERSRCCFRNRGNLILVGSRSQNDSISASINECELDNPNFSGIGPSGPNGRAVAVLSRNLGLGAPPDPFGDSQVSASITKSMVRAGRGGSGVFAINFATHSDIAVLLFKNKMEGGVDANGGVSRPDPVTHSSTSVLSIGNLFRPSVPGTIDAWFISGGSGAPITFADPNDPTKPYPPVTTEFNSFDMYSFGDRIENCRIGVVAKGGQRSFPGTGLAPVGPSSNNSLRMHMVGVEFKNNSVADLNLIAAKSVGNFPTGDFNTLGAVIFGARSDDNPGNFYADTAYGPTDLELPPENQGQGNQLAILGSLRTFLLTNDGFDEAPPPAEFFTRGK